MELWELGIFKLIILNYFVFKYMGIMCRFVFYVSEREGWGVKYKMVDID